MILSHLGIGLLILGITGSSIWQKEKIIRMNIYDQTTIHNYTINFKEINTIKGPNYTAIRGVFLVYDDENKYVTKLNPENRFFPITNISTTEASIHVNLLRDLYIVLGEGDKTSGWIIRIYYNPLVIWIWIGAFTIFLGGLISTKNNIKSAKKIKI